MVGSVSLAASYARADHLEGRDTCCSWPNRGRGGRESQWTSPARDSADKHGCGEPSAPASSKCQSSYWTDQPLAWTNQLSLTLQTRSQSMWAKKSCIKGVVYSKKKKMLSLFTNPYDVSNLYNFLFWNPKEDILKNVSLFLQNECQWSPMQCYLRIIYIQNLLIFWSTFLSSI